MASSPNDLLKPLFEYIGEQRTSAPRGFQLSKQAGFIKEQQDTAGLPGVDLDVQLAGDRIWLRVQRLETRNPHMMPIPALRRV
jgi:hypothetical protein